MSGYNGFAFEGLNGIETGLEDFPGPALYTSDGGWNWLSSNFFDECYQPCSIPNTSIFLAASEHANRVSRSDDGGMTWRTIFQFSTPARAETDSALSGCIRSDYCGNVYISSFTGFFISSDSGVTWKFIGGPPNWNDVRFWISQDYIYACDQRDPRKSNVYPATLWRYPLHNRVTFVLADSSKQTSVTPGTDVSINVPVEINTSLGSDSLHLVIRYDSAPLELKNLNITGGLSLLDSSINGDTLNLWVALDSNTVSTPPNISLTFKTFLSTSLSAKIHLDSIQFYGGCQTCNCALAVANPDSVEIDFTNCADTVLLDAMEGKPLFSIVSIVPNPASSGFRVSGTGFREGMGIEIYDVLGETTPCPLLEKEGEIDVDVSSLPAGTYYLRMSEGGYVQTRKIVKE